MRLRQLISIFYLKIVPDSLFLRLYRSGFFEKRRDTRFTNPKMSTSLVKVGLLGEAKPLIGSGAGDSQRDKKSHDCKKRLPTMRNKSLNNKKFNRAFIVYPHNWMNKETFEFAIHSNFIRFIQQGLEENLIKTNLIDEEKLDEIEILGKLDDKTLVIFYSLSALDFKSKCIGYLQINELKLGVSPTKIGVITASPTKKLIPKYMTWTSIVSDVVYYEEESEYSRELSKIFRVIHLPLIQYSSSLCTIKDNGKRIHFSGTLKYNRSDWLIVLRALCITLGVHFECKIVRETRTGGSKNFAYLSETATSKDRMQYSLGVNFAQREPGIDAKLIGSFWDYYRNGCIPIVIGENTREMATYMELNSDYFSVKTEEDLRDTLISVFDDTHHLLDMRQRIYNRVHNEFNPKVTLESFLAKI